MREVTRIAKARTYITIFLGIFGALLLISLFLLLFTYQRKHTSATSKIVYQNAVSVLMYHSISDSPTPLSLSTQLFQKHMDALKEHHFHVISMKNYIDFIENGKKVPDNAVLLTFDDGFEDFYTNTYPILKRIGYAATDFVIVKYADSPNPYDQYKRLTWPQMMEMQQHGMSFYSHTYNSHHKQNTTRYGNPKPELANLIFLTKEKRLETEQEYENRVKNDLSRANELLASKLGEQPQVLAFPYGAYNDTVLKIGEALGIKVFFTIQEGLNDPQHSKVLSKRLNVGEPGTTVRTLLWKLQDHYLSRSYVNR